MQIRFAQIEPTTRCNFTCGFCAGRQMPQQDLPLAHFQRFIDAVEELEALELQGEGEPLLHPDFFRMIALARQKFPLLEISLITNGSLFTPANIAQLLEHRVARLFVSVESVNPEDFRRIRGGKLDRVRRGLGNLLAERGRQPHPGPVIGLSVTLLRSTIPELASAIPLFYRELGLDGGLLLQPLQGMPQYRRHYDHSLLQELIDADAARQIQQVIATSAPLQAALQDRARTAKTGFYERLYSSVNTRERCPWLDNGIYLSAQGELVACCHIKDYGKYSLGSVDTGLATALDRRNDRQNALSRGELPDMCTGCGMGQAIVARQHGGR